MVVAATIPTHLRTSTRVDSPSPAAAGAIPCGATLPFASHVDPASKLKDLTSPVPDPLLQPFLMPPVMVVVAPVAPLPSQQPSQPDPSARFNSSSSRPLGKRRPRRRHMVSGGGEEGGRREVECSAALVAARVAPQEQCGGR
ncbi:hypothetical protein E2562_038219 [Oryza meyeriana var. granulata]|uniref:Uncharacterized protein n=1 Tax=Oryza meyeriana var. granulata TaxID=110450 RepID=A0A6G1EU95_9ORYZ|nr:hypothetical protein E2562_038219 [Oryza meyeriana var. granulata]